MFVFVFDEKNVEDVKCFTVDKDGKQTAIEPVDSVSLQDNNYLIVSNGADGPRHKNDFDYLKFEDSCVLNQRYKEKAQEIADKYSRALYNVNPSKIAFEVDMAWELSDKTSANSRWKVNIVKAPKYFERLAGFEYIVKMRQYWIDKWTEAQVNAAIMSQLLRINPEDGAILKYNEDIHSRMIATFGKDYLEPGTVIADVLKDDVKIADFRKASGQVHMDELPDEAESTDPDEPDETDEEDIENEIGEEDTGDDYGEMEDDGEEQE